jgi:hypothetical protein
MNQHLMPLGIGQLPTQSVMGFVGNPRNYRFDGSRGFFKLDDETAVTKPEQPITIIPLSFRLFYAENLFQKDNVRWIEMTFLNQGANICHVMWHEWSVENFLRAQIPLTYDGKDVCDVAWTLTPIAKTNRKTQNKYFMLKFGYDHINDKTRVFLDTIRAEHKLYRDYTLKLGGVTELASKHWFHLKDRSITTNLLEPKALPASVAPMPQAVPAETAIPKKN